MKHIYLLLVLVQFFSCDNRNNNDGKVLPKISTEKVDTTIFSQIVLIDTSNCMQFYVGRMQESILVNEKSIVRKNISNTYLSTNRYRRLWVCNFPELKLNINDTVLVSGIVYSVGGSEGMPGYPTVVYQIRLKKE